MQFLNYPILKMGELNFSPNLEVKIYLTEENLELYMHFFLSLSGAPPIVTPSYIQEVLKLE